MRPRRFFPGALLVLAIGLPAAAQPPAEPGRELIYLLDDGSAGPILDASRIQPEGETFVDPSTSVVFPKAVRIARASGETIHMAATGSGVRKKLMFKVYAAALYVDVLAPLGTVPVNALASADIPRRLVMSFRRDVSGDQLQEAMREGFEHVWKGKPGPELAEDLDLFYSWMAGGIRSGQTIELTYIPGEGLYTTVAGVAHRAITRSNIARGIWHSWLGVEPISAELKWGLVRFLGKS